MKKNKRNIQPNDFNANELYQKKNEYLQKIRHYKTIDKDNKEQIDEMIQYMVDEINKKFTYEQCLFMLENQSNFTHKLYSLLRGYGNNGLSVESLNKDYLYYKGGKYNAYDFMCDVGGLLESIVSELTNLDLTIHLARDLTELEEWIFTGKIKRMEEYSYERS